MSYPYISDPAFIIIGILGALLFACDRDPIPSLQGQTNTTLTFYGKAVDQDGQALDAAEFEFRIEAYPKRGKKGHKVISHYELSERARFQAQSNDYFVFVHGWRVRDWERVAFAESTYKRMFWSNYAGQFALFGPASPTGSRESN